MNVTNFVVCDAMSLPFIANSFDYVVMAFGIRNVPDIQKVLEEIKRVLKKGGKFLCLEFSQVENKMISNAYDFYSFKVIPKIGQFVTNNGEAYQYLVESIKKFPSKEVLAKMLVKAGFQGVNYKALSLGVVAIHCGYNF